MEVEIVRIVASLMGLVGSAILAYRVTGILKALSIVAMAHELNINQLMRPGGGDIAHFGNSSAHVEQAQKMGLLISGFALVVGSATLQLFALLLANGG